MSGQSLGWALLVVGLVFFLISAFAEPLGLGDNNGIGLEQIGGMVVGGVVAAIGLALWYVRRGGAAPAADAE